MTAPFVRTMREWIRCNAPAGLADQAPWWSAAEDGESLRAATDSAEYRTWERRLADANLICPSWPVRHGGRALSAAEVLAFETECARAGVPRIGRGVGERALGPAVLTHGTEEQKARLLPRIVSGAERHCRGYAEPEHGSDLASVTTRGTVDGEEIVVSGRKTWVGRASTASVLCVLCSSGARGLSFVLVPVAAPGVELRPVRTLTGEAAMHEVTLESVKVPLTDVIGGPGHGWTVAKTATRYERERLPSTAHLRFEKEFWDLVAEVRKAGRAGEPAVRARLAWLYERITLMRLSATRLADRVTAGAPPGPLASAEPLLRTEFERRFAEIAVEVTGMAALTGEARRRWMLLAGRAATIDPETSELRRNALAEQDLGLPGAAG